jgi:hypothetical protein
MSTGASMSSRRRRLVGWVICLAGFAFFAGTSALSLYAADSGVTVDEVSYQIQQPGTIYLATDGHATTCTFTGPGSGGLANKSTGTIPRTDYATVRAVRVEISAAATVRCTSGTATLTRGFVTQLYPLGENEYVVFGYLIVLGIGVALIHRAGGWRPKSPANPKPIANKVRLSTGRVWQ